MSPRTPQGLEPMTSAERVRRSRWVNKVESAADELLEMLKSAPEPLPREPLIEPELLERLFSFNVDGEAAGNDDYEVVRFLKLGNGHQVENKRRALACAAQYLKGSSVIDRKTIKLPTWGTCHFSAYTHPKAAMVSTPNRDDHSFGSAEWHNRDHVLLFRDVGDGRCIIYICDIAELFNSRAKNNNGEFRHGVYWGVVKDIAKKTYVIPSADALKLELDHA